MVLFRSALKQVARRTAISRASCAGRACPTASPAAGICISRCSTRKSGKNLFVAERQDGAAVAARPALSRRPARACARRRGVLHADDQRLQALSGVNSMAPIQAVWGRDNRGVMLRVLGGRAIRRRIENRIGEPLANPYLYMASQIHAGLDGIARKLAPAPSADAPYEIRPSRCRRRSPRRSTRSQDSACFRAGFGDAFVDYHCASSRPRSRAATPRAAANPRCGGCHRLGAPGIFRSGVTTEGLLEAAANRLQSARFWIVFVARAIEKIL